MILPPCPLPPGVVAGCSTREGGVSDPPWHSLNISLLVGDEEEAVRENRMRLADRLPAEPRWLRQAHGARVLPAESVSPDIDVADVAYATTPGVVCAVQTADCLPVLLWTEDARAVAAAHAGWRGLAAGALENAVAALRQSTAAPAHAFIGPHIRAKRFIVGEEVRAALRRSPADDKAFAAAAEPGKWHADLAALAVARLRAAGVAQTHVSEDCVHADKQRFFSARRDNGKTGRQAALIHIAP